MKAGIRKSYEQPMVVNRNPLHLSLDKVLFVNEILGSGKNAVKKLDVPLGKKKNENTE